MDVAILRLGERIPDWKIVSIFDEPIPNTINFLGSPLLILFFNLGCPGCLGRAIPYANRVVYEKGDKINVIGIHTNFEGIDFTNQQFQLAKEQYYFKFPFFKDFNFNTTFLDYGAGGTPHWVLVDAQGIVSYSIFGSEPNNALLRLQYKINELINLE